MAAEENDNTWISDIKSALADDCDDVPTFDICQGQSIPACIRPTVWKSCLGVPVLANQMMFDEIFDLPEQSVLRDDCQQFVDKLGNEDEDKLPVLSDLETILTHHRKSLGPGAKYERGNGWIELLIPLLNLQLPRKDTYCLFQSISNRYIPCNANAFNFYRLLLLYHDPQLCSFLDTKRITPDLYTGSWFLSLFAGVCKLNVTIAMWDMYFQQGDPFFVLFLSLVMVVNAREQILSLKEETKSKLIEVLLSLPAGLELEDVSDFCSLAQYYTVKTPSSFREILKDSLFSRTAEKSTSISQALCLPVSVGELIENIALEESEDEGVRFFLVDCRPADQYNAGHLPTAFHLDCNLMVQEPVAFATAVQGLLSAQRQALAAGSAAGGEHLCFVGCGRLDDDQYTHMVVASFLHRNTHHVSLLDGGYQAIHRYLGESVDGSLSDHNPDCCLVCLTDNQNGGADQTLTHNDSTSGSSSDLFSKIGAAVKMKSAEVKGKLLEYIVNPSASGGTERHVSSSDKVGKRYRNMAPVFCVDDDQDPTDFGGDEYDEEELEISISSRLKQPDVVASFKCQEVTVNNSVHDCHLVVSATHIYVLREVPRSKDKARLVVRRPLSAIAKITCKKKQPELITFQYGEPHGKEMKINDQDRFNIPESTEATKLISKLIVDCIAVKEAEMNSTP
ncbi:TBC1 domain family member 23 isoform X3 [Nilaparvata lugens]|uniref:TBC1 domain family member 23 isoform X3 n=1 Tax=Nilaparvata lugens TaxID=108931 RepID=UPI00193E5E48|nr:TBC1 domain family member 23 isoform X3 [Nilaparvata lugens]